ncbi:MAG: DegT/DnrJ/EryC1/StrS family aminotransferase, partial [Oscillospiraceae bacterium]|nr:DegT/DnrJ/EryC1/StrS family aminotransferase [Oscillospiraceae bacterium]
MQFIDLKAQYARLKEEIDTGISNVLCHGKFISGPEVAQLEKELADYAGVKHCVSCANGTDALELLLMAAGIGAGDAVFVPSFTFMSTAEVVSVVGATPVFVDINEDTFNMDAEKLAQAVAQTKAEGVLSPRAIIAVDLFGQCADHDKIAGVAADNGLLLFEDGAQGFGGTIGDKRACSFGDAATTSFFPAKPLGCYGDGGAIFTNDDELCEILSSLRIHGKGREKYDNVRVGRNSRLDTMQAAILVPKLHAFAEYELEARHKWADRYTELLSGVVKTPVLPEGFTSSWAQYTIILESEEQRDGLKNYLSEKGIPSMVYYPRPLHRQTAYLHLGYEEGSLPVSEKLSKFVLSLPMHPYL